MQNFHFVEYSEEAFRCRVHNYQCLEFPMELPPGPPSIDNGANDTEKLLLNTQVSEEFAK